MRYERSWWGALLIPTLVPELEKGVNAVELVSIAMSLLAGTVLALNYWRATQPPATAWLMVAYLSMSFLSLTHDPPGYFISHFAGGLAFTIAVIVGGSMPVRIYDSLVKWMFVLLVAGATLDILADLSGWSPVLDRSMEQWEEGMRGEATSRSLNGMYLAPFMALMVASSLVFGWRIAGAVAFPIVFYHVVVFGQGRGSTALALLGIVLVLTRRMRSLPGVLLVLFPFFLIGASGILDDAVAPFVDRLESEELTEVDRIEHARIGEKLVRNMSSSEVMSGINYRKVIIANGGMSMHNALFDTVTRYGLFATAPWIVFNIVSLIAAGRALISTEFQRSQAVAAAVVIQMLGASMAAPIFVNWRSSIVPGICTGLVLRVMHSRGALNTKSN